MDIGGFAANEEINAVGATLDRMFPEQKREERTLQRAKSLLGELAKTLSPEELKVTLTEIQFLSDSWLDEFERKIFDGRTLTELLHEKGAT